MKALFGQRNPTSIKAGVKAPVLYLRRSRMNPDAVVLGARRRTVHSNGTATVERFTIGVFNGKKGAARINLNMTRELFGGDVVVG